MLLPVRLPAVTVPADPLVGARILLVDDTEAQRYVTARWLTLAGAQVVESATGYEGLAQAQDALAQDANVQDAIELVILDINLPDISGREVARRLKDHPVTAHLPVLHVSSEHIGARDRAEGLDAGADGYLMHPVEPMELLATARSLLRLTRTERALHERTAAAEQALIALAASETLFRTVQDASTTGFGLQRPLREHDGTDGPVIDFELTYVNPAGALLLGRTPESLRGASVIDLFPGLLRNGMFDAYLAVLETGVSWTQDIIYQDDGFDLAIAVSVVRAGSGPAAQLAVSFTDIRARVLFDAEQSRLREATDAARSNAEAVSAAAEQANVEKSTFLVHMSHELRTPLNAILGYTQLLELGVHGPVTAAQQTTLGRIGGAQRHMLGLVNDVLDFATLSAGRVQYHLADTDVQLVLANVLAMVEPQRAAKALSIDVHMAANAAAGDAVAHEPIVWADPDKLSQVLLNLVANAIKFTPSGGTIRVELAVREHEPCPPGVVFIRVADSGIGIPADQLQSIFDPFVQVQPRVAASPAGSGLGLAISRGLVQGMGGELRVRSTVGTGSAFTITLPRVGLPGQDRRDGEQRRIEPDRRVADAD